MPRTVHVKKRTFKVGVEIEIRSPNPIGFRLDSEIHTALHNMVAMLTSEPVLRNDTDTVTIESVWTDPPKTRRSNPDECHLPAALARELTEAWKNGNRKEAVRRLMTAYSANRLASFRLLDAFLADLRVNDETFDEGTLWTLCGTYQSGQWK